MFRGTRVRESVSLRTSSPSDSFWRGQVLLALLCAIYFGQGPQRQRSLEMLSGGHVLYEMGGLEAYFVYTHTD